MTVIYCTSLVYRKMLSFIEDDHPFPSHCEVAKNKLANIHVYMAEFILLYFILLYCILVGGYNF